MTQKTDIVEFVAQSKLALIGVSRGGGKFSNAVQKELLAKGYTVYAVNPAGGTVDGRPLYPSLAELPEAVESAVIMVRPEQAANVARDCVAAGVKRVWFQQGSQSPEALQISRAGGLRVIDGECILMYAGQAGFHKFHRFFRETFGKKLAA